MRRDDVGDRLTCPRCGVGRLVDVAFDAPSGSAGEEDLAQRAESREVLTYSCGHVEVGPSLATADADRLDVERRRSEETAAPSPDIQS